MRLRVPMLLVTVTACGGGADAVDGATPDVAAPDATVDALCVAPAPDAEPTLAGCPVRLPPAPDRLDEALTAAGLDRCTLGYTDADLALFPANLLHDPDRLPFYDTIWRAPLAAVPWAEDWIAEVDAAVASGAPSRAIQGAAARLGYRLTACTPPGVAPEAEPLATAVAELITARGGSADPAALAADAADLPLDLQESLAVVIRALADAAAGRDRAIAQLDDTDRIIAFYGTPGFILPGNLTVDAAYLEILRGMRFDYAAMYGAAADLALAIEQADLARHAGATGFSFRADTPLGLILVGDAAPTPWDPADVTGPVLLLVDTGGGDDYLIPAAATADAEHGISVVVDLEGDDTYHYDFVPDPGDDGRLPSDAEGRAAANGFYGPYSRSTTLRQGGASLGIALLYDLGGGTDRYQSLRMSQGFGSLGVGVLYDDGGDDITAMEIAGQGAGVFGIGLLLDGGGSDERRTYSMGQGFAYVRGAGVLADAGAEDDIYYSEPDDAVYYSPQLPGTGNSSFTQGAGFGRRDDAGGVYMSGGFALLRDGGGNDAYTTSVFGQGTGYWFGIGILSDEAGADSYDGKWYVQGADAHFASCLFLDDGGDDRYNQVVTPAATSIGVGHDFSNAFHIDRGGHDVYRAPGLSLGSGNVNGVGILINIGGDDEYHAAGEPTLAAANLSGEIPAGSLREQRPTVGIFIDIGGTDLYDVPGSTVVRGDDTTWTNPRRVPPLATEHSAGLDAPDGDVVLP